MRVDPSGAEHAGGLIRWWSKRSRIGTARGGVKPPGMTAFATRAIPIFSVPSSDPESGLCRRSGGSDPRFTGSRDRLRLRPALPRETLHTGCRPEWESASVTIRMVSLRFLRTVPVRVSSCHGMCRLILGRASQLVGPGKRPLNNTAPRSCVTGGRLPGAAKYQCMRTDLPTPDRSFAGPQDVALAPRMHTEGAEP
jgi:hypothetical protein